MDKLKYLETKYMECNNLHLLNQINTIKQEVNKMYESQMEMKAKFIKQSCYKTKEDGSKAKKLLAWRMRQQQAERSFTKSKIPLPVGYVID